MYLSPVLPLAHVDLYWSPYWRGPVERHIHVGSVTSPSQASSLFPLFSHLLASLAALDLQRHRQSELDDRRLAVSPDVPGHIRARRRVILETWCMGHIREVVHGPY